MKFLVVIFTVFITLDGIVGVLPPNLPRCRRNMPNISDCVLNALEIIRPRLANGDLGGGFVVPGIEPFKLRDFTFGEDKGLNVHLSNVNVYGCSQFKVEKLRVNINDLKFDVLVTFPKLDIYGKYKMSLNFLGAPVKSNGDLFTQYIGPKLRGSLKANRYTKNGVDYIKFEPIGIKFDRGTVNQLKLTNLFGGNKVLSEIVHSLLLNNPDYLLKSIYPHIESQLSRQFTDISNKIVESSPVDELLPV